jgi:hypothetical protein
LIPMRMAILGDAPGGLVCRSVMYKSQKRAAF